MGRTWLTPDLAAAISEAVSHGHSQAAAARIAGLKPATLEGWLRTGREHLAEGRRSKYTRLLESLEDARVRLRESLDAVEWGIAMDAQVHPAVRLRAVDQVRRRVFGPLKTASTPAARLDVYHHPAAPADSATAPPLLADSELARATDAQLSEILQRLRQLAGEDPEAPTVIDSGDV